MESPETRADADAPLAVLCRLPATERVMERARRAGVYDDDRSVVRADDHAEVPVTAPLAGHETVVQRDPVPRRTGLDDLVDVADPPSSWRVVGDVVLVDLRDYGPEQRRAIARGLRELHGAATVLDYRGVEGVTRDPIAEVVCGSRDTETEHREHGYRFRLDPRRVMFSCGNAAERRRVERLVDDGERVLDMFAGIGYFAVPAAVGGAQVTATEIDRVAHRYLEENAALNGVADAVDARHADCCDVDGRYDRVVMGHFDAPWYVEHAVERVRPGGTVHLHGLVSREGRDAVASSAARLIAAAGGDPTDVEVRTVKPVGAGTLHVVADCRIG